MLIVAECVSVLVDYPLFERMQLDLDEISVWGGVFYWYKWRNYYRYDKADWNMSLIVHDAQDSPNHHEGENLHQRHIQRHEEDIWVMLQEDTKLCHVHEGDTFYQRQNLVKIYELCWKNVWELCWRVQDIDCEANTDDVDCGNMC